MRKTPRWLKSVIAEADKTAVKLPFERGNRRPSWVRETAQPAAIKKLKTA
ncbi:MAG: hypothetical protein HRT60_05880 [Dinoroseobacter sp.]|nr:hypothetical protein [Dinoroseobacter sp.]